MTKQEYTVERRIVRNNNRGMTLLEVVFACGLFAVLMTFAIRIMASDIQLNRVTAMQIAANNAVRAQIEEIMTVARDNLGNDAAGDLAKAAVFYYGNNFTGQTIDIGPKGASLDRVVLENGNRLVYHFSIPEPGDAGRAVVDAGAEKQGERLASTRAIGRMVIYLGELAVEPTNADDAQWNVMWRDIGQGNPDVSSVARGFDLNRDGKIDNLKLDGTARGAVTWADLRDPRANLDVLQLPVDINVIFFTNASHEREVYRLFRRVVVM